MLVFALALGCQGALDSGGGDTAWRGDLGSDAGQGDASDRDDVVEGPTDVGELDVAPADTVGGDIGGADIEDSDDVEVSIDVVEPPPPLAVAPSVQDSEIQLSGFTPTSMTLSWARGNGASRVVYVSTSENFVAPADRSVPVANSTWNGAGQQAVYVGPGGGVTVSGLTAGVTYHVRAYGFNGRSSGAAFVSANATNNPTSGQLALDALGSAQNPLHDSANTSNNPSTRVALLLRADVATNPNQITLRWTSFVTPTGLTIYRKEKSATTWGEALASPAATATEWVDTTAVANTYYEYRVSRASGSGTAHGYVAAAIDLAPIDDRGKMVLLVDETFAVALSTEIAQLVDDLTADGWGVVRVNLARSASVASVRGAIKAAYDADPERVRSVYILGHLAVAYSGNIAPDGHDDHRGAWPCDGYYGEMDGVWTDTSVNSSGASRTQNRNTPGDGKFDQSSLPSDVELQVGRVDLYDLPAFAQTEVELMRNYLNKAHEFKHRIHVAPGRAVVQDNLQWVGNALAETSWRSFGPLTGANNIVQLGYSHSSPGYAATVNKGALWSYGSGGGYYNSIDGVGNTTSFVQTAHNAIFNMTLGSYFGDWDSTNNVMRAMLASGRALTNTWAGIPSWFFHHMALGDTIGYSTRMTQNNRQAAPLYLPQNGGWHGQGYTTIHLGLMGDPSLRMHYVEGPSALVLTPGATSLRFAWAPAADDAILGYHVYRVGDQGGPMTRLTTTPVLGTSTSVALGGAVVTTSGARYMVRTVKRTPSLSGTYQNLSLGALATIP
ncbi:MAG: fibronectin type III domain-containing protein [Bradymonadaceae bacterium]|nr:fibronectin type III domain-containing protein [Lujinxingiaceae bacterium]